MIGDTIEILHAHRKAGNNILFEGAQGSLLDIDHGTYPFVTSSIPRPVGRQPEVATAPFIWITFLGLRRPIPPESGLDRFPLNCLTKSDNTWPP